MDYLKEFVIPCKGLKEGNHQFTFRIDERFFEEIEYSELTHGNIRVDIDMLREERMITLIFSFSGNVDVLCDRCASAMQQEIEGTKSLFFKIGDEYREESDEVIIIPESEHSINVMQYIYEFINLLLPVRRVHPLDEQGNSQCDPEVVQRIDQYKKENTTDPRWDALKKLKQK